MQRNVYCWTKNTAWLLRLGVLVTVDPGLGLSVEPFTIKRSPFLSCRMMTLCAYALINYKCICREIFISAQKIGFIMRQKDVAV